MPASPAPRARVFVIAAVLAAAALAGCGHGTTRRAGATATTQATVQSAASSQDRGDHGLQGLAGCRHPRGPYHVRGDRVVDSAGRLFVPYGITTFGLATPNWPARVQPDRARIRAMARYWCVNTVRIQAAPHNLLASPSPGNSYNAPFLGALVGEVRLANRLGLTAVITAQTELAGQNDDGVSQVAPTEETLRYWLTLGRAFSSDDSVIFDLFNEPRLFAPTPEETWSLWRDGGYRDGAHYLGMQELASDLRGADVRHLFWVEGPYWSRTLAGVGADPLAARGVVYTLHHPVGGHNARVWDHDFGDLAARSPVVVGEWTQYASAAPECWPRAAIQVPRFLDYLRRHRIGLVAWALLNGVLVRSPRQVDDPTRIGASYACLPGLDQGAGQLIRDYFLSRNGAGS